MEQGNAEKDRDPDQPRLNKEHVPGKKRAQRPQTQKHTRKIQFQHDSSDSGLYTRMHQTVERKFTEDLLRLKGKMKKESFHVDII